MIVGSTLGNIELRTFENPNAAITGAGVDAMLDYAGASYTGRPVTAASALTGTVAVWACVSLKAETVGSLPVKTYERIDDLRREPVSTTGDGWPSRIARLIHSSPNPEMTAQELWENAVGHYELWGNAYINVVRGGDGRPVALWPLRPDCIEPMRDKDTREKFYRYRLPSGERRDLLASEVMHVKGLSIDGLKGLSRIEAGAGRNAVGMEQAGSEFAGRFFANGAIPAGALTIPDVNIKTATEKARLMRDDWQNRHGGLSNANRIAILYGGTTYAATGMPLKDAQFLEQRQFQVVEIARLFRTPLHMIQEESKDTSWGSGIESMALGYLTFNLRPTLEKFEGAIDRDLGLVPGVKTLSDEGYYPEFDPAGLLRADAKTQAEVFQTYIQNRVMNPQQVAGKLNLPFDEERPTAYENPNTTPADVPDVAAASARDDAAFTHRAEQLALAFRQAPPQTLTVNMPETHAPEVHVEPAEVRVEAPVTVNVPEQPAPVVNVETAPVTVNVPEPKRRTTKVTRDERGAISGLEEE